MTVFITSLTLLSNIVFVCCVLLMLIDARFRRIAYDFVSNFPLVLIFLTSLGAMVFSLIYSNVVNFPPCELCWIQRILIYPQVLLSYMAMRRNDLNMISYLLPLTVLGIIISFYHSLVHWGLGTGLLACTASDGECAKVYVLEYGYITIPFMALSSFVYLFAISFIYKKARNV